MAQGWYFKSRPNGLPSHENFELGAIPDVALGDGQIRVANSWLSVDPYMRGRMNDAKSYVPGFELGSVMQGGALGRVIESRAETFAVGDLVMHMSGWRDESIVETTGPTAAQKLPDLGVPDQTWLHNLGLTGATAYFGLLKTARAKAGETVFVSAAAGAVGMAVVQIARQKGMTVIGSAGGPEKCEWVRSLGAQACIDYKAGPVLPQLARAAPDGIDVYFDNVGGEHLDAAFAIARNWARFAICGMIDVYNDGKPMELKYLIRTIPARISMQGFIFTDYLEHMGEFMGEMGQWVLGGHVVARETVHEGLDSMVDAFLGLFSGQNIGKMLVRL